MTDYELVFARCDLCREEDACARVASPGMSDVCIDICLDCARAIFYFIEERT